MIALERLKTHLEVGSLEREDRPVKVGKNIFIDRDSVLGLGYQRVEVPVDADHVRNI